jgi:hypothetical protein
MWLEEGMENEWIADDEGDAGTSRTTMPNSETIIRFASFTDHYNMLILLEKIYRKGQRAGIRAVQVAVDAAANSVFPL